VSVDRKTPQSYRISAKGKFVNTYYALLGLYPSASEIEIRRAYRELSKRYHPDTTDLAPDIAKSKFQKLNEAYGTLSSPERRALYDLKIGYSRINVIQAPDDRDRWGNYSNEQWSRSAYLDPNDRPLSAGEIFILLVLGATLLGCLLLAIAIGLIREDRSFEAIESNVTSFLAQKQIIAALIFNFF